MEAINWVINEAHLYYEYTHTHAHSAKGKKWRWKNKKCAHELNCLFLFSFSQMPYMCGCLFTCLLNWTGRKNWACVCVCVIERRRENEKTIRVHRMDSRMALLSHIFTYSHSQCVSIWFNFPNDTIQFQGDIRHFYFSQWACVNHICTQRSISAWFDAFFGSQQSHLPNNQHTNISAENETPTEYNIVLETMKDRDAGIFPLFVATKHAHTHT